MPIGTLARAVANNKAELTPLAAANLIPDYAWYKADELALADNSLVSSLTDFSANGLTLTASGSNRPVLIQERWNGKPGIVFSGAQILASGSLTSGLPTTDVTVFAVVANYKRGSSPQFVALGNGSTFGFNLFGSTVTDASAQPPAMIVNRGGTWGDNEAIMGSSAGYPSRGDPILLTGLVTGSTTKLRVDRENQVTDSSASSSSINYGTGTVKFTLGDKGSAAGPLQGVIYEVIVYTYALTSDQILVVEEYLDEKWRVTRAKAAYVGLYNGESSAGGGSNYATGFCWSPDNKKFKRWFGNPYFTGTLTGTGDWDNDIVKDQWHLWDQAAGHYVLYYSGLNLGPHKFQIGRATFGADFGAVTRDTHNPIIALGATGSIDAGGCSFPTVVKDLDETNSAKVWKMWYAATDGSGNETIAYAYSADGISWTKFGRVINLGGVGTWYHAGVAPGCAFKSSDGTWYLFVQGRASSGSNPHWQGGVWTFLDPEGTYTAYSGNPTITSRSTAGVGSQTLTANLSALGRTVTVANTSGFSVHEPVFLDKSTSSFTVPEVNRVLTIDSSTQLTLEWPVVAAYPTSDNARIVSAALNSVIPRSIRQLPDGTFEFSLVPFQPTDDGSHSDATKILREMSMRGTADTLTSSVTLDNTHGLMMLINDAGKFDELSAENLRVVPANVNVPTNIAGLYVNPRGAATTRFSR